MLENWDGGAVLIWAFVDDLLVHSLALKSVEEALRLFLDSAVDQASLLTPKSSSLLLRR